MYLFRHARPRDSVQQQSFKIHTRRPGIPWFFRPLAQALTMLLTALALVGIALAALHLDANSISALPPALWSIGVSLIENLLISSPAKVAMISMYRSVSQSQDVNAPLLMAHYAQDHLMVDAPDSGGDDVLFSMLVESMDQEESKPTTPIVRSLSRAISGIPRSASKRSVYENLREEANLPGMTTEPTEAGEPRNSFLAVPGHTKTKSH